MSGTWVKSLPELSGDYSPEQHRGLVLSALGDAVFDLVATPSSHCALHDVRLAAAHLRAWRRSLPKDEQGRRIEVTVEASTDTLLRTAAICMLVRGDITWNLRQAEACLRVVGKRLAAA